jgi:STE24 endopeptidase
MFEIGSAAASLLVTLIAFGHLSRRFERQADVFAARMMQVNWGFPIDGESANHWRQALIDSHVGEEGAAVFSSSLYRVATINNIPTHHRDWFHGSILRRMRYLTGLSADPQFTGHFDRIMVRLYVALGAVLLVLGLWTALQQGAIPC